MTTKINPRFLFVLALLALIATFTPNTNAVETRPGLATERTLLEVRDILDAGGGSGGNVVLTSSSSGVEVGTDSNPLIIKGTVGGNKSIYTRDENLSATISSTPNGNQIVMSGGEFGALPRIFQTDSVGRQKIVGAGQSSSTGSVSVVLASDHGPVAVTGSVSVPGTGQSSSATSTSVVLASDHAPVSTHLFDSVSGAEYGQQDGTGRAANSPTLMMGGIYLNGDTFPPAYPTGPNAFVAQMTANHAQYVHLDSASGPQSSSGSVSVVLATDHGIIPVSGTIDLATTDRDNLSSGATAATSLNSKFNSYSQVDVYSSGSSAGAWIDMTAAPAKYFSIQVTSSGSVTSWDVRLECSLTGTGAGTPIITHTQASDDQVLFPTTAGERPCRYIRSRPDSVVESSGSVSARIVGLQ